MIPQAAITEWAARVPWPTPEQIEQDLLLSRLIVEIDRSDEFGAGATTSASLLAV